MKWMVVCDIDDYASDWETTDENEARAHAARLKCPCGGTHSVRESDRMEGIE